MLGNHSFSSKAFNFRTVLEIVRMQGPISRADIARHTDLTAQTISNITKRLLDHSLIKETEKVQEGRGAPSTGLVINPNGAYSIGLDIDQDHLTGLLMDFSGKVLLRKQYALSAPKPEETIALMIQLIEDFKRKAKLNNDQVWGIGIGVPGPVEMSKGSLSTNIVHPIAFQGWDSVPIVELIHKETALPVYLENNATAAAIGEQWFGRGREFESYFYFFLGLGLGGGLILNRLPYRGFSGNAGEIGFIPKSYSSSITNSLDQTHVGIYFNIPNLFQRLQVKHPIREIDELVHLFETQEPILMEWLQEGAEVLSPLLLSIEYLMDPEAILLGGRLPKSIIAALIARAEEILPNIRIEQKRAFPSLLAAQVTNDAAALGVATIPLYEVLKPLASLFTSHDNTSTAQPFTTLSHPIRQIF